MMSSLLLIGSAALFTGLYKYAVFAVQTLFIFLLNGFIMLLRPFFSFLETAEFKFPDMEQQQMEVNDEGDAAGESFKETPAISEVPVMTILMTLAAAGIAVFLIMYFKKRSRPDKESSGVQTYKIRTAEVIPDERMKDSAPPPYSKVRKQYYMFEKWLAKRKLGRYHGETIDEWAGRIGISNEKDKKMLERYKNYRYDNREMPADEFNEFKEMIKNFKRTLDSKKD